MVARCMEASEVIRSVLGTAWLACSCDIFREKMQAQLRELERDDFAEERRAQFTAFMTLAAKRLRDECHSIGKRRLEAKVPKVPMFCTVVPFNLGFAGGEWVLWCSARVRSIAVNANHLAPVFPWQDLLTPPGSAEGVSEALQLPPELLADLGPLKSTIWELLGDKATMLIDIIKCMRMHKAELVDCHRSFKLDISYLENRAGGVLKDKVASDLHDRALGDKTHQSVNKGTLFPELLTSGPHILNVCNPLRSASDASMCVQNEGLCLEGRIGVGPVFAHISWFELVHGHRDGSVFGRDYLGTDDPPCDKFWSPPSTRHRCELQADASSVEGRARGAAIRRHVDWSFAGVHAWCVAGSVELDLPMPPPPPEHSLQTTCVQHRFWRGWRVHALTLLGTSSGHRSYTGARSERSLAECLAWAIP